TDQQWNFRDGLKKISKRGLANRSALHKDEPSNIVIPDKVNYRRLACIQSREGGYHKQLSDTLIGRHRLKKRINPFCLHVQVRRNFSICCCPFFWLNNCSEQKHKEKKENPFP